jgi:hypothetical protein
MGIFAARLKPCHSVLRSMKRDLDCKHERSPRADPLSRFLSHSPCSVAPRPIAWVSTLNKGELNLAPFSFFNAVSAKPPLLGFSPSLRLLDGQSAPKDTLHNIRETGEFVGMS